MSMPKLNAPAEIHWRRSNMNTRDPILMKSVEVLKDCRSLNAAAEMNCPMPRSVEKVPIRNEKRCSYREPPADRMCPVTDSVPFSPTNVRDSNHADSFTLFALNIEIVLADVTRPEKSNIPTLT